MNREHSQNDKNMRLKQLGGNSKVLAGFCINIGKLEGRRTFSQLDLWEHIVRWTISFCNIYNYNFACWRKLWWNVQMLFNGCVEGELFHFQPLFVNCEIVLTCWIYILYECSPVYFMIISTMSNECFHRQWAILLFIYLFMFMCFESKNNYLWFFLMHEQ